MLRTLLIALIFILPILSSSAQTASVEKSLYGIQSGIFGLWFHNELRLSEEIVLRSETGLDAQLWGSSAFESDWFSFQPVFTIEPRWYSNLGKRSMKGKNTRNNSGNFKSLKITYRPDLFVISNIEGTRVVPDLFIAPTIGLKRSFLNNFNYEFAFSIGWLTTYYERFNLRNNVSELAFQIHLRIGYTF